MFSQRRINFSTCFLKGKNTTLAPSTKLLGVQHLSSAALGEWESEEAEGI